MCMCGAGGLLYTIKQGITAIRSHKYILLAGTRTTRMENRIEQNQNSIYLFLNSQVLKFTENQK